MCLVLNETGLNLRGTCFFGLLKGTQKTWWCCLWKLLLACIWDSHGETSDAYFKTCTVYMHCMRFSKAQFLWNNPSKRGRKDFNIISFGRDLSIGSFSTSYILNSVEILITISEWTLIERKSKGSRLIATFKAIIITRSGQKWMNQPHSRFMNIFSGSGAADRTDNKRVSRVTVWKNLNHWVP